MNYYEKWLGDYARDTTSLSQGQHGAYNLAMDYYYTKERGIPNERRYAVTKSTNEEERANCDFVLSEYFRLKDGRWIKNRIEEELDKARARIETARVNGAKGGRPKKDPGPGLFPEDDETQGKPAGFQNPMGSCGVTQTEPKRKLTSPQSSVIPVPSEQAPAERTPVDRIFGGGLAFLIRKGVAERQARGFLGKLRKSVGDDIATLALLQRAELEDVTDPIPWLSAGSNSARAASSHKGKRAAAHEALGEAIERLEADEGAELVSSGDREGDPRDADARPRGRAGGRAHAGSAQDMDRRPLGRQGVGPRRAR